MGCTMIPERADSGENQHQICSRPKAPHFVPQSVALRQVVPGAGAASRGPALWARHRHLGRGYKFRWVLASKALLL